MLLGGTLTIDSAATLALLGSIFATGTIDWKIRCWRRAPLLIGAGTAVLDGGGVISLGGGAGIAGGAGSTLDLVDGTLAGGGIGGVFGAAITLGAGGTIVALGGASVTLNAGAATIASAGELLTSASALLDIASPLSILAGGRVSAGAGGVFLQSSVANAGTIAGACGAGGGITLTPGTTLANAAGGLLTGTGTVAGAVLDNAGTVAPQPGGVLHLASAVAGGGVLSVAAGSTLAVDAGVAAAATAEFGGGGVLALSMPASFAGVIDGFGAGATLALDAVQFATTDPAQLLAGNTLEIIAGSATLDLRLDPAADYAGLAPHLAAAAGGVDVTLVACFVAGRRVLGDAGEIAVERLAAGNASCFCCRIVTLMPVVWVGHRRVREASPVRVFAGAFGAGMPHRDLWLSPDHAIFIDGGLCRCAAW